MIARLCHLQMDLFVIDGNNGSHRAGIQIIRQMHFANNRHKLVLIHKNPYLLSDRIAGAEPQRGRGSHGVKMRSRLYLQGDRIPVVVGLHDQRKRLFGLGAYHAAAPDRPILDAFHADEIIAETQIV